VPRAVVDAVAQRHRVVGRIIQRQQRTSRLRKVVDAGNRERQRIAVVWKHRPAEIEQTRIPSDRHERIEHVEREISRDHGTVEADVVPR